MITDEQAEKLHEAIDKAEGLGECQYIMRDGAPGCVIGQLALLEGASGAALYGWDAQADCQVEEVVSNRYDGFEVLEGHDTDLLSELQAVWDLRYTTRTTGQARAYMHELVDTWNTGE